MKYQKPKKAGRKRKPRKIIFFNPPFSKSVKTNVIKLFLGMIDKHFPKGHKLHKTEKTYNSNGRSKLNAEQIVRPTIGSLQTPKKTPSCIFN